MPSQINVYKPILSGLVSGDIIRMGARPQLASLRRSEDDSIRLTFDAKTHQRGTMEGDSSW